MAKARLLIVGLLLTWALAGVLVGVERMHQPVPAGTTALSDPEEDRLLPIEDVGRLVSPYRSHYVYDDDLPLVRIPACSPPSRERLAWSDIHLPEPEDRLPSQPGWECRPVQEAFSASFYEYDRLPLAVTPP